MPQLNSFFLHSVWLTFIVLASLILTEVLLLLTGRGYSVEDTEAHASDYAEQVKEGHGGMNAFLWLSFLAMFIFAIVYFVQHWHEFQILFRRI